MWFGLIGVWKCGVKWEIEGRIAFSASMHHVRSERPLRPFLIHIRSAETQRLECKISYFKVRMYSKVQAQDLGFIMLKVGHSTDGVNSSC